MLVKSDERVTVLKMEFSEVEGLSGAQESVSTLFFAGFQFNFRKNQTWVEFPFISPRKANGCLGPWATVKLNVLEYWSPHCW